MFDSQHLDVSFGPLGRRQKQNRNHRKLFAGTETGTGAVPFCQNCTQTQEHRFPHKTVQTRKRAELFREYFGDKFGESLGGSQATPSFWEVPALPRKFPELPRKFFGDFPGSSLAVELSSNPGVPRKFPKLPRKFPNFSGGSRTSPEVSPFLWEA